MSHAPFVMRAHTISLALPCLALCLAPSIARAQPSPDVSAQRQAARALADRGLALFEEGRYADALDALREADEAYHDPTVELMMARACERLGRLEDALEIYQRLVSEELKNYAPDAFFEAQAAARPELQALLDRMPTLEITVEGAEREVAIQVDGKTIAVEKAAAGLPLAPGEHVLSIADGPRSVRRSIQMIQGRTERAVILLAEGGVTVIRTPARAPREPEAHIPWVPTGLAFGIAAVGLGVGAATGVAALGRADDVKAGCEAMRCWPEVRGKADNAHRLATISTIGFAAGVIGLGAGITLAILRPARRSPGADLSFRLQPGSAAVRGAF